MPSGFPGSHEVGSLATSHETPPRALKPGVGMGNGEWACQTSYCPISYQPMSSLKALVVALLFAVGVAAQPAGPIPTGDPTPSNGSSVTLQDTASPANDVGTVTQSNMDIWDFAPPSGSATALVRKTLPSNSYYSGDGWLELNSEGQATGYVYVFFKNSLGYWRWEKRACTANSDLAITSIGASAGYGPISGV